ncbi:MAG: hypothetical protein VKM34_11640 [Cyanobacteriota bacterium]|nr:hypothetical protein [Cyanobacteriota bacterium]
MRGPRPPLLLLAVAPALLLGTTVVAGDASVAAGTSEKEAFMLMFGKGNGAMRLLCALERDGVISPATRRRYAERLEEWVSEPGDSATDRRHVRVGKAFAEGRRSLCNPPVPR